MRLATFSVPAESSAARVGVLCEGGMLDLARCAAAVEPAEDAFAHSMRALLEQGDDGLARARRLLDAAARDAALRGRHSYALEDVRLLPPLPDAEKFLCVGKNYRTHLAELKRTDLIKELPEEPTGFIKLNACLVGQDAEVERPVDVPRLDYEPELVFVIGKPAYRARREDAFDYVAGITILNDLTCRDTQKREVASGSRFWTAKNAPGFGPLGPYIITMDEVRDVYDIWVTCSVNGEERMRVNTSDQIWKLPDIIEHFSRLLPLKPGDMFSTGAPGGVAVGKPNAEELFLKPGDVVECAFEEPAMALRTRIVAAR
ncbi:Homoprotocatechuate catabolism bifunctional isomerase/decarboxylase [Pigmentiphaga humi]|uniref:Homoprotocatechuate catabolism bifunctional isomerase/decarboxylase n=1 Tax=Pigmentiphaga humi TaxID=2478468 RepID=A0A3P4B3M3_9BURK|nr:fumarylacetoacetate hydrolase family protein [Pigmentiphaga humi]VCU70907.1 Homoprotocatechuate catabolism bifunctional isomerase/decarboxylase [Pigmentiphaga humi]